MTIWELQVCLKDIVFTVAAGSPRCKHRLSLYSVTNFAFSHIQWTPLIPLLSRPRKFLASTQPFTWDMSRCVSVIASRLPRPAKRPAYWQTQVSITELCMENQLQSKPETKWPNLTSTPQFLTHPLLLLTDNLAPLKFLLPDSNPAFFITLV